MRFSLATLWFERQRFFPALLAVTFAAVLVALQFGLLIGTLSVVTIPIDHTRADVWVGAGQVQSVDVSRSIPARWQSRTNLPEIERVEVFYQDFGHWQKPEGGSEMVVVVGSRLGDDALGTVAELTPELRLALTEPGAVVVDEADLGRLGIHGVGAISEVNGERVRVVGLVRGVKGLSGPYLFCSAETGRRLLRLGADQVSYLLIRCQPGADVPSVVRRLAVHGDMSVMTSAEFSWRSRWHWLFQTGAGIALGCAALLGLIVGGVITNQTLYAAAMASLREYAVLRAMGIPRRRLAATVLTQAFWVGFTGVLGSIPVAYLLAWVAGRFGARASLPDWLLLSAASVTLATALLSGVATMRALRQAEPATLLR